MTREQALRNAIGMLDFGMGVSPERATAMARAAMAWVAIADRLPVEGERVSFAPAPVRDVKKCGHTYIAWKIGDHWVHPGSMARCDDPPELP